MQATATEKAGNHYGPNGYGRTDPQKKGLMYPHYGCIIEVENSGKTPKNTQNNTDRKDAEWLNRAEQVVIFDYLSQLETAAAAAIEAGQTACDLMRELEAITRTGRLTGTVAAQMVGRGKPLRRPARSKVFRGGRS